MIRLWSDDAAPAVDSILCFGAHGDDIEIGCGGTLLRLLARRPAPAVTWVVLTSNAERRSEAVASANRFLAGASKKDVVIAEFRDGFLPWSGEAVKSLFEELKGKVSPDVVFTHYRDDRHQDHRLVSDLTWNTFRDHLILEYEIPKYDGDFGVPNAFVHLDDETCERKIRNVVEHFSSQHDHRWFTPELFRSVMRLRGMESNAPEGYAEAFYGRKLILW
jgi:LmbE family N-acetylglucosaminyl deacetylase